MTDERTAKQIRKETIRESMARLEPLSRKQPWWCLPNKGCLYSKHGMYLNWLQGGLLILGLIVLIPMTLWVINTSAKLKTDAKKLVDIQTVLIAELEACRDEKDTTPAEK